MKIYQYQYWFIICDKYTIVVSDVNSRVYVNSVLFLQVFCKLKTILK